MHPTVPAGAADRWQDRAGQRFGFWSMRLKQGKVRATLLWYKICRVARTLRVIVGGFFLGLS
jgi:hypothetical protein